MSSTPRSTFPLATSFSESGPSRACGAQVLLARQVERRVDRVGGEVEGDRAAGAGVVAAATRERDEHQQQRGVSCGARP